MKVLAIILMAGAIWQSNGYAERSEKAESPASVLDYRDFFTAADFQRIQLYYAYLKGEVTVDEMMQRFFDDPDFNRASIIFSDLYSRDKNKGILTPEMESRFQALADRLGTSVFLLNRRQTLHKRREAFHIISIFSLTGAVLAGVFLKDSSPLLIARWFPRGTAEEGSVAVYEAMSDGRRIWIAFQKAMAGHLSGAAVGYISYATYRFWKEHQTFKFHDKEIPVTNLCFGVNKILDAARGSNDGM